MSHETHPDDLAVDAFAIAMKAKLAEKRAQGYGGWEDKSNCPAEQLQSMLVEHLAKGDPVDIGNFAMMLWNRGEPTAAPEHPAVSADPVADLRMDAYYFGFYSTGTHEIDLILSAVACAGKAFHHTEQWNDECSPYRGHTGDSPVDWIQNAADKAAKQLQASRSQSDADERDAGRYRALQAEAVRDYVEFGDKWYESSEDLDSAADALFAAQKGGEV